MNFLLLINMLLFGSTPSFTPYTVSSFEESNDAIKWYIVNDGVMGGLSQGKFMYSQEETGVFSGNISLDNNGGFSWLRGRAPELNLENAEGIAIRVKGTGRTFGLTLMNPERRRVLYFSSLFETKTDEWIELELPLDAFKGYFYGQNVDPLTVMNPSKMKEIGFILYDKAQGPFRLEIDWIKAY